MMLPEHIEKLIEHQKSKNDIPKPIIDEQEWNRINEVITTSLEHYTPINLSVYKDNKIHLYTCCVNKIDLFNKKLDATANNRKISISINDIVGAEII
ncbi:YolD-like family protein [Scopulibacillus cellulosilyticus]|uniref:YolD-like family protein n=1 Tax=Scopulibacillus cellulosilyticus TaxID=2665665 RepID=A0ABW2PZC9_9BACL